MSCARPVSTRLWDRVETEPDYLARLAQPYDIILCDYKLPLFDGMRALRLREERGLDTPLIIVSGTIGEDVAVRVMQYGADDYLLKRLTRCRWRSSMPWSKNSFATKNAWPPSRCGRAKPGSARSSRKRPSASPCAVSMGG